MTTTDTTAAAGVDFRMRGLQVTRIEALSDVVFAFALTMLGVSLGVPQTFDQLVDGMRDFPAFAICFAVLIRIWHDHYRFFRRYGLQDGITIFLNSVLLFIVILFVYCLKFLVSLWVIVLTTAGDPMTRMPDGKLALMIRFNQAEWLIVIFGIGFASVYAVFALLYAHAYRLRDALHLNQFETFDTRNRIIRNVLVCGIGLIAAGASFALGGYNSRWAGWAFVLIPVVMILHNSINKERRMQLIAANENELRDIPDTSMRPIR
jgi:uncharacterized membrane protein